MVQVRSARRWHLEVERGPDWLFVRPSPVSEQGSRSDNFVAGESSAAVSDTADDLAGDESSNLAKQVWALLEQTLMHRLVLELDDVDRLDANLVKQILWLQNRIHGHEGILRVCGLSKENQRRLREHHVDGQIAHYCDRESAVMCQDRPRHPR